MSILWPHPVTIVLEDRCGLEMCCSENHRHERKRCEAEDGNNMAVYVLRFQDWL